MKHREYVGPEKSYDLIAAMTFNLLTSYGLRGHHRVLDIGCGSLRNGRLLIQYLNSGNYVGIDPNGWLITDAIKFEIGEDIIELKKPTLIVDNKVLENLYDSEFDYIFAQSIFSHAGLDIISAWFQDIKRTLKPNGLCFFTYIKHDKSNKTARGWTYPNRVNHCFDDIESLADGISFEAKEIDCKHPHSQQWVLMRHK